MEGELAAFAPMAIAMCRLEARAATAEQATREAEQAAREEERLRREADRLRETAEQERDEALAALNGALVDHNRDVYRRGYRAGWNAQRRGGSCDPERSMSDARIRKLLEAA